jgi:hypothetical protein
MFYRHNTHQRHLNLTIYVYKNNIKSRFLGGGDVVVVFALTVTVSNLSNIPPHLSQLSIFDIICHE